jgi:ketosteroid isomerase-like protein
MAEAVRTSIGPDARLPTRRTLEERLCARWPRAYAALARPVLLLPPRSRLRRAVLRRSTLSGCGAWARGDLELTLLRNAPDCRYEPPREFIAAGMRSSYEGHSGVREWAADVREAFERMDITPLEIVDAGNPVVLLGHAHLRARGSGIEFDTALGSVFWIERGLIVRNLDFADWDEALRAAGIPTAAMASRRASPIAPEAAGR